MLYNDANSGANRMKLITVATGPYIFLSSKVNLELEARYKFTIWKFNIYWTKNELICLQCQPYCLDGESEVKLELKML